MAEIASLEEGIPGQQRAGGMCTTLFPLQGSFPGAGSSFRSVLPPPQRCGVSEGSRTLQFTATIKLLCVFHTPKQQTEVF